MDWDVSIFITGAAAGIGQATARLFAAFDMNVDVECFLPSGEDTVVALGHYRGVERRTGRRVHARFAHVLDVDEERITALEQITDTRCWASALRPAA